MAKEDWRNTNQSGDRAYERRAQAKVIPKSIFVDSWCGDSEGARSRGYFERRAWGGQASGKGQRFPAVWSAGSCRVVAGQGQGRGVPESPSSAIHTHL